MKKNVGGMDRIIRVVLGVVLLAFAFFGEKPMAYWGFIGVVPLLTAILKTCPLYNLVGINTCPSTQAKGEVKSK